MKFKFFIFWFVVITVILLIKFSGDEDLFLIPLFSAPIALVATIIHKWVTEAESKITSIRQPNVDTNNQETTKSINLTKPLGIFILLIIALYVPELIYLMYIVLYFFIQKSIEIFTKNTNNTIPWFIGGTIWTSLCFLIYFCGSFLLHGLNQVLSYQIIIIPLLNFTRVFHPSSIMLFATSVIFYEWYSSFRKTNPNAGKKISIVHFILVPIIVYLILFFAYYSIIETAYPYGFAAIGLWVTLPLALLLSSIWIFIRDHNENKIINP